MALFMNRFLQKDVMKRQLLSGRRKTPSPEKGEG
jgi:hypothetical protein